MPGPSQNFEPMSVLRRQKTESYVSESPSILVDPGKPESSERVNNIVGKMENRPTGARDKPTSVIISISENHAPELDPHPNQLSLPLGPCHVASVPRHEMDLAATGAVDHRHRTASQGVGDRDFLVTINKSTCTVMCVSAR